MHEARRRGIEVALDIAFQASPDHPWVKEHPEWFRARPDGTIQYAENPPKKYQDIYPFDFESSDWRGLWDALNDVFRYWIGEGVTVFRVDNPHTKAFAFWEWVINDIKRDHPQVLFLAEAFTRPKIMYRLAKLGFSQSYTYFTWRNSAWEMREYMRELTSPPVSEFFRPNFWPNTPDILHADLQDGRSRGLRGATCDGGNAVIELRHLRPGVRAWRERAARPGHRGVPRLGEVPAANVGSRGAPFSCAT